MKLKFFSIIFFLSLITEGNAQSVAKVSKDNPRVSTCAYLFTYFTGKGEDQEAIRFAISNEGYNFRTLNRNKPILNSLKISSTGGLRDPHIMRAEDGKTFYMVATDMNVAKNGWGPNYAMVFMQSTDLVNWKSSIVNIPELFPEFSKVNRVWAPQTIYDKQQKKYMIYWSMRTNEDPDKIYYAYANKDFTSLESTPKQLFFSPDNSACIDGDIAYKDGKYHLFFKTEDQKPGIKQAISDKLTEGYTMKSGKYLQKTNDPVEGAGTFKLNNSNTWILMYDVYKHGKYQFTKTSDLENFSIIDHEVSMNFHPRHGTVMPVTSKEAELLVNKWYTAEDVMLSAQSKAIKKININLDTITKRLILPVKAGTNLKALDPGFMKFPGVEVSPKTPQNFSSGAVKYNVKIKGRQTETFEVIVREVNNPVLSGYFADPDVLYSEKTKKFYIYPTSDGFDNWSGTYFKAFSSSDLVNWKDEGVILDLEKDVSWAKRNAWAPAIIEKKIDGKYKYFYYFSAAQQIGVAIADDPAGPFVDSGKPLIDKLPEGIKHGQQIDPDVFNDPKTGKCYLYWGNAYMAGAELNQDMISIKPESLKVLTPDATFREGTYVFYRNGKYYFSWSEDDTGSENYRVRYGTTDHPLGKITIPQGDNLMIKKLPSAGIYGTGHHSVLQIPGKDEWYIVYHRLTYPNGINLGPKAGYYREVCIDKLEFNADGSIKPVVPTHAGVKLEKR